MAPGTSRKRGPQGLGSTRQKKQRLGDSAGDDSGIPASKLGADSKTIALPGDLDEDDELGQLCALYSTAVVAIQEMRIGAALPVLNGTIHEADRMLRNTPDGTLLPFEFHRVYACALVDMSLLIEDEKAKMGEKGKDFIDAALERCNLGLENGQGDGVGALKCTKARAICRRVQNLMAQKGCDLESSIASAQEAMTLIDESFRAPLYASVQLSQTFSIIQDLADSLLEERPELHESMNKWAETHWTKVLTQDQENVSALEGCGRVWLSLAQPGCMELENKDEGQSNNDLVDVVREKLETAVELLTQALKCAEKQNLVTGNLLCLVAEATISMANTFDEGPHYDKLEKATLSYLQRAEQLDGFEIPDRFRSLLTEVASSKTLKQEADTDDSGDESRS